MDNGSDASFMFDDKFSVVNSTVMPARKIQRWSHIFNHHRTRESQAKGIIKFVNMNGNDNPADIVTKSHASNTWSPLVKPLLLLRDMDFLKERVFPKGIEDRTSTPPLYQAKVTPHKSFKLELWHILGEQGS